MKKDAATQLAQLLEHFEKRLNDAEARAIAAEVLAISIIAEAPNRDRLLRLAEKALAPGLLRGHPDAVRTATEHLRTLVATLPLLDQ